MSEYVDLISPDATTPNAPTKNGNKFLRVAKNVLSDPALYFAVSNILLFAGTGGTALSLWVTAGTCALIAGSKVTQALDLNFVKQRERLQKIISDERTTLILMSISGLVISGIAVFTSGIDVAQSTTSVGDFVAQAWRKSILPFLSSSFYVAANTISAFQITREQAYKKDPNKKRVASSISKLPEPYIFFGNLFGAWMVSSWALLTLPIVVSSTYKAVKNALKVRPEHTGYPKVTMALSSFITGTIGLWQGNVAPAVSYLLDIPALLRIESMITPGGFKRITNDIKTNIREKIKKIFGKSNKNAAKIDNPRVPHPSFEADYHLPPTIGGLFKDVAAKDDLSPAFGDGDFPGSPLRHEKPRQPNAGDPPPPPY